MPYEVKVDRRRSRPYKIVDLTSNRVVGTSTSRRRANASIAHRLASETAKPRGARR